jgi:hypothetical protein
MHGYWFLLMKLCANDVRDNDYLEIMDGPVKGRVAEGLDCMAFLVLPRTNHRAATVPPAAFC